MVLQMHCVLNFWADGVPFQPGTMRFEPRAVWVPDESYQPDRFEEEREGDVYALPPGREEPRRLYWREKQDVRVFDSDVRYALFARCKLILDRYNRTCTPHQIVTLMIPTDQERFTRYPRYLDEAQHEHWVAEPEFFDAVARREQQLLQFLSDITEARRARYQDQAVLSRRFDEFVGDLYYLMCTKEAYRKRLLHCTFENPSAEYEEASELQRRTADDPYEYAAHAERRTRWLAYAWLAARLPPNAVVAGVTRAQLECTPAVIEPQGRCFQGSLIDLFETYTTPCKDGVFSLFVKW